MTLHGCMSILLNNYPMQSKIFDFSREKNKIDYYPFGLRDSYQQKDFHRNRTSSIVWYNVADILGILIPKLYEKLWVGPIYTKETGASSCYIPMGRPTPWIFINR